MRRLKGGVPRGLKDHRSADGKRYLACLHALTARLGPLPESTRALQRIYARLDAIEIPQLEAALDAALARRRQTDARRIRRQLAGARMLFLKTEERLAAIAAERPSDLARLLSGAAND